MFASLTEKLQETFQKLRGKGKLNEKDVDNALREIRLTLLEADVNYKIVKNFIFSIKEQCIGREIFKSLTPAQQVIKIVNDELGNLMGKEQSKLEKASSPPTVIMLVGLQGSGKTTTVAKLANYLHQQGNKPIMVAADIYRPAAIKQLELLGEQLSLPVFSENNDPPAIAVSAYHKADEDRYDYVIIDTAGRLHVNEELMQELEKIKERVHVTETLLVVDAMTGQDAVNVASSFHNRLNLSGVILTKLDGDTRGGAALSVRAVTGCPIKFVGIGEKLEAFEPFYPDRMASRILGMGDVLSLIEKAQTAFDAEKGKELEKKLRQQQFTLEDFSEQLQHIRQMGSLEQLVEMLPGIPGMGKGLKNMSFDENQLTQTEAIINSMTKEERLNPEIVNSSRRKRIALGSGTRVQDVNRLLKQFEQMKKLLKQFNSLGKKGKFKKARKGLLPFI